MSESNNPYGDPPEPKPNGQGAGLEMNKDARQMAMLAHLLGILLGFLGPLIIWLIKKDEHPFVDDQGKEALNFQLMILIGYVVSGVLACVLIGYLTFLALFVMNLIFSIMGTMQANNGHYYRYPMNIRFIK